MSCRRVESRGIWAFAIFCGACGAQSPAPSPSIAATPAAQHTATSSAAARAAQTGDELPWFLADTLNAAESGLATLDLRRHVGAAPVDPRAAVVLSFGRFDCAPCKKELPELAQLDARYRPQGVLFAVVILDEDDQSRAAMRRWLVEDAKLPLPAVDDRAQILARRFDVRAVPLLIAADRHGRIVWRREGYEERTVAELEERLEALIRSSP